MREFDHNGLLLAGYQARIFELSVDECNCSSPVFLRRYLKSSISKEIDRNKSYLVSLDHIEAIRLINEQFNNKEYGQIKYTKDEMFWMGYLYRYICYTRDCSTAFIFNLIPPSELKMHYYVYHTQGEEWVIRNILESKHLSEDIFDKNKRLKTLLQENIKKTKFNATLEY